MSFVKLREKFLEVKETASAEHIQIAQGAIWVVFFTFSAKLISAAKEMVVAWRYGVGDIVDAYQLSNTFMLWLPTTISVSVTVVLIPILVSLKEKPIECTEFLNEFQTVSIIIGTAIGAGAFILLPMWLPIVTGNLTSGVQEYVQDFSAGFLVPAVVSLLIAMHSARLMAMHKQWNTLFEAAPALVIFFMLLVFPKDWLVAPLLLGTALGYLIQLFLVVKTASSAVNEKLKIRFSFRSRQWVQSRRLVGMMLLGQFLLSWVAPIDTATAARLGEGAIAQLGYAERLLSLLLGLGATAISRSTLPVFSEIAATEDWNKLLDISIKWGLIMFIGGLVISAIAWFLAPWVISTVYERGAFTSQDTLVVVDVFRWGLTRIPFYFSGLVFFQLLASQRLFGWIAFIAFLCAVPKYSMNEFFAGMLGVAGINFATGIMYAFSACSLYAFSTLAIKRRLS